MRPRAAAAAFAATVVAAATLSGCADDYELGSTDVEATGATEVAAGDVEVVLPAGAATGGTLAVQEGPEPTNVPRGVVPLGSSAMVTLFEGTLEAPLEVSFEPPAELTPEQVPIAMAKEEGEEWRWLPTTWDDASRVTARMSSPGQVFLARFDPAPWVEEAGRDFTAAANEPGDAERPTCGDEDTLADAGLEVSGEPTELVQWCAGVDTIGYSPSVAGADTDYSTDGVQAPVLRLTNTGRMFREVGYPEAWAPVDGSGRAPAGQQLRERLGLAGTTRDGLGTRLVAPGETLTLLLPGGGTGVQGTVTADLSAAAWMLSSLEFAAGTYAELVTGVDEELGAAVGQAGEELVASLAGDPGADPGSGTEQLRECLAPVEEVILMNAEVARRLLAQAFECTPPALRPALPQEYGTSPATMADAVATSVLAALPPALGAEQDPWAQVSDATTDPQAGLQVWLGPPPAQEHDYSSAPYVFRPGDEVEVPEWGTELTAYVEERLDLLLEDAGLPAGDVAGCPDGAFSVSRYTTDGFARAGLVTCDGEEWRLVLGRSSDGWQELDQISQDPYFGCSVLGTYSVPAFVAGDTCLDDGQSQEYPG